MKIGYPIQFKKHRPLIPLSLYFLLLQIVNIPEKRE